MTFDALDVDLDVCAALVRASGISIGLPWVTRESTATPTALSCASNIACVGNTAGKLAMWDLESGTRVFHASVCAEAVRCVACAPAARFVAACGENTVTVFMKRSTD
jgi:hypothetical protein